MQSPDNGVQTALPLKKEEEMYQLDIFGSAKKIKKQKSKIENSIDKKINAITEKLHKFIKSGVLYRSDTLYDIDTDFGYIIKKSCFNDYDLLFLPNSDTTKICNYLKNHNDFSGLLQLNLHPGALNTIRKYLIENKNPSKEEFIKKFNITPNKERIKIYATSDDKKLLEEVAQTVLEFRKLRYLIDTSHPKFNKLKNRKSKNENKPGCFDGLCIEKNITQIMPFIREIA